MTTAQIDKRGLRDSVAASALSPKWAARLYASSGYFRIYHYRFPYDRERAQRRERVAVHGVVVLLNDGRYFMGGSKPSFKETYSRKLGFRIALGRALKKAATSDYQNYEKAKMPHIDDPALPQVEIGKLLREKASNYCWGPPWG